MAGRGDGRVRGAGVHPGADYTADELEFLRAVQAAKKRWGPYLSWPQVLRVAKALGYRRAGPSTEAAGSGY